MGLIDWLFRKKEDKNSGHTEVCFTVRTEKVEHPSAIIKIFSSEIEGNPVIAEVPTETKSECEKLLQKETLTEEESEFLYNNYWVNIQYKGEIHGYHGCKDIWTHSARSLPELSLIHAWIYSILGKIQAFSNDNILTDKMWEDAGNCYALGKISTINVQLSFKPNGYVLSFLLADDCRLTEKAAYNTRTNTNNFPFYYRPIEGKITEWAVRIFEESRK